MFHKIPKNKKKSFQFKHRNSKSKPKDGSSTLAYPHTAHIHCGPTNELTQNQSLGPISKALGPAVHNKSQS